MESSTDLPFEGFCSRESLWKTVEKLTPENSAERSEIKTVIGESLVDETIDLHTELSSLNEIWQDFNKKSQNEFNRLPEPPLIRENLEKQITVLVELLQQKMKHEGSQAFKELLSDEERGIIKSVARGNSAAVARKHTASNQSSARSSPLPLSLPDMNMFDIDKLAVVLTQGFEEERKNLLCDIEKIQVALLNGSDRRRSSPSIKDLQHLNKKLEKKVLSPSKPSYISPLKPSSQNSKNIKWSNNFQNPVKLSPSPPSVANTSSYKHPNLLPTKY